MRINYEHAGAAVNLEVDSEGDRIQVRLPDGEAASISARVVPDGSLEIEEGGRRFRLAFTRSDGAVTISYGGRAYEFTTARSQAGRSHPQEHNGELAAPMTGAVVDVLTREGEEVRPYQPLVVVEAMKVLATVEAPFAGRVAKLHVRKGDRVDHGDPLLELTRTPEG